MEKDATRTDHFSGGNLGNDRPEMRVTGVNGLVEADRVMAFTALLFLLC